MKLRSFIIASVLILAGCDFKSPREYEHDQLRERCHGERERSACETLCAESDDASCFGMVSVYFDGEAERALLGQGCRLGHAPTCATLAHKTDPTPERLALYREACEGESVDGCHGVAQLLSGLDPTAEASERDWPEAVAASLRACRIAGDGACLQARFIEALGVRDALCASQPATLCEGFDPHALAESQDYSEVVSGLEQICRDGVQASCVRAERLGRADERIGARLEALE